ncbi:hypothetical protein [Clostridium mediterraneense]|uniref:hypothetical protein n=1 Tax=Clostridium mediterraneense TaxID=1805472 RepID=UPI00082F626E|nr:hypothetical protein [Clostridium mediterraneense]
MKKILVIITIVILGTIGFFVGKNLLSSKKVIAEPLSMNNTKASEDNTTAKTNIKNTITSNVNSDIKNTNTDNKNNHNIISVNNSSNSKTSNSSNNKNITSKPLDNTEAGTISYNVPNYSYSNDTILVKNTTGKPISSTQLSKYIKSWILVGQNNYAGLFGGLGTFWAKPWLDKVPASVVKEAFVKANGVNALSNNITAIEFVKTTQELDVVTAKDVPFTLAQASVLIKGMLQKDGYADPSQVVKITFQKGAPGYYLVYTKESLKYNTSYWCVYANTGYAHG